MSDMIVVITLIPMSLHTLAMKLYIGCRIQLVSVNHIILDRLQYKGLAIFKGFPKNFNRKADGNHKVSNSSEMFHYKTDRH